MSALFATLRAGWADRSGREQALLVALGVILAALAGWYLVAAPLLEFRNNARTAYIDSVERYRTLSVGVARYQALAADREAGASADTQPLRTVVAQRAAAMDLPLSRMVPDEDGRLNVWTENANAEKLMNWLADLEQESGIVAIRANIDREGNGLAGAQIVLERRAG
jgi:type II secretory pathway component PulM